jgi:hypothetical protein
MKIVAPLLSYDIQGFENKTIKVFDLFTINNGGSLNQESSFGRKKKRKEERHVSLMSIRM